MAGVTAGAALTAAARTVKTKATENCILTAFDENRECSLFGGGEVKVEARREGRRLSYSLEDTAVSPVVSRPKCRKGLQEGTASKGKAPGAYRIPGRKADPGCHRPAIGWPECQKRYEIA